MKALGKISVVLGFHVNYNHSYRGDTNDNNGFGYDTKVIRDIIKILDRANENGLDAHGTWEFDNFWSAQNCMRRYAPDIIENIARRVRQGRDEIIIDNWNNGSMAWMTREELRISMERAITNQWGSGVRDMFGDYSPVIRAQETMFTHGCVPVFKEFGLNAICMYYSAAPFDALRNFVPRLSPNERYNPLTLKCPVSDENFIVLPMYSQADVLDNLSLEMWLRRIRRQQESGEIPGDAIVFINMDADAAIWTGFGLPRAFSAIPNVSGLDEYIKTVNKLDNAEFGNLGDYVKTHEPVGEIRIDRDTADGSFTGFNSWTEKWINYPLWTLHQRARRMERAAAALLREPGAHEYERDKARALLYGPGLSNIECRTLAASTTHFGLASPMMSRERLRVAFHFANTAFEAASEAAATLLGASPAPGLQPHELARVSIVNFNKYEDAPPSSGAEWPAFATIPTPPEDADPLNLRLIDERGRDVHFDFVSLNRGEPRSSIVFLARSDGETIKHYTLIRRERQKPRGLVNVSKTLITNGLVTVRLDDHGFATSLQFHGREYARAPLLKPGVTYRVGGHDVWFAPREFVVEDIDTAVCGPCGRYARLTLYGLFDMGAAAGEGVLARLSLQLVEGLPYLFISGCMDLPETRGRDTDRGMATRLADTFDNRWREIMPLNIQPGFSNLDGQFLKVWKHNYLNVTHGYELDFGAIDPANKNVDAFNNHVTDGWVAVSNGEQGLLVAHDQSVNTSAAMCPMRLRERNGRQRVSLNPFGTYYGAQLSHLPDGSGAARELTLAVAPHLDSTAPSYNGREIVFQVMLAPYQGDAPPAQLQKDAAAFAMPALALEARDGRLVENPGEPTIHEKTDFDYKELFHLEETRGWTYSDFLDAANKNRKPAGAAPHSKVPPVPPAVIAKIARDVLKAALHIDR